MKAHESGAAPLGGRIPRFVVLHGLHHMWGLEPFKRSLYHGRQELLGCMRGAMCRDQGKNAGQKIHETKPPPRISSLEYHKGLGTQTLDWASLHIIVIIISGVCKQTAPHPYGPKWHMVDGDDLEVLAVQLGQTLRHARALRRQGSRPSPSSESVQTSTQGGTFHCWF